MADQDDFYLDDRGLASYFEASWLSKFRELGTTTPLTSASGNVPEHFLDSPFFTAVVTFLIDSTKERLTTPVKMLEIGPALGRTCHETLQRIPSIRSVTVVEPSNRLLDGFRRLLIEGKTTSFPYIHSLRELGRIDIDSRIIAEECSNAEFELINEPVRPGLVSDQFDLVYCLNVIDNAATPVEIVSTAMACTKPGGVLVLSCTYQWSKKYLTNPQEMVNDINEYFDSSWEKLGETEIEYRFRHNERFSQLFCPHVVVYQKRDTIG